jgi:tetratricopeptide (TPR) repeat protein
MLAGAARRRLMAGGLRAAGRQDYAAAASLFERAAALVPAGEFELLLEIELGQALDWAGRAGEAIRRADALAERAAASGDRVGELCGRVQAGLFRMYVEPQGAVELSVLVEESLPVFRAAGDDMALHIGYSAHASVLLNRGEMEAGLEVYERALAHARQGGYLPPGAAAAVGGHRYMGRTPAPELLVWLNENEPRTGRDHFLRAYRAGALAMVGRFDESRAILAEERAHLAERGGGILLACITSFESVRLELMADDPVAAAEFGATGFRMQEGGAQDHVAESAGTLAQALYALDRLDEADDWADRAAKLGTTAYPPKEMIWRQVRAKVLARRGEHAEAERLAHEAVAIGEGTDMLNMQRDTNADLAEVLLLSGKPGEAAAALEHALDRYERKGNLTMARRTRDRLTAAAVQRWTRARRAPAVWARVAWAPRQRRRAASRRGVVARRRGSARGGSLFRLRRARRPARVNCPK